MVRARDLARLGEALERRGHAVRREGDELHVRAAPEAVGEVAAEEGLVLHALAARSRSLEAAFFALTGGGA